MTENSGGISKKTMYNQKEEIKNYRKTNNWITKEETQNLKEITNLQRFRNQIKLRTMHRTILRINFRNLRNQRKYIKK